MGAEGEREGYREGEGEQRQIQRNLNGMECQQGSLRREMCGSGVGNGGEDCGGGKVADVDCSDTDERTAAAWQVWAVPHGGRPGDSDQERGGREREGRERGGQEGVGWEGLECEGERRPGGGRPGAGRLGAVIMFSVFFSIYIVLLSN